MKKAIVMVMLAALVLWSMSSADGLRAADDKTPATGSQPATSSAPAGRLIVWDGDEHNVGGGWVHTKDVEKVATQTDDVHSGKTALGFTAKGQGWHQCGWNWRNWTSKDGTDISAYPNLVFWAKVKGDAKPRQLVIVLVCSDGKATAQVDAVKYCPKLLDGEWHEVTMPVKDIIADKTDFDAKKAWEIQFANWCQDAADYVLCVDDIGFAKAEAK